MTRSMRLARTILAAAIAVAITMLPVAGSALAGTKQPSMSASMSMTAAGPMDDCCPDHAKQDEKAVDDCCAMAACALTVFSFSKADWVFLPPAKSADVIPRVASERLHSQAGQPPFRPPRV